MNRRKGCLWFAAGLILALMAGITAFITLQRVASTPKVVEEPPRVAVLVAARDIPLHTVVSDADLAVQQVPPETVPADALSEVKDALGKLAKVDLARGEMILLQRLIAPDYVGPAAAFVMDPARVIVAFPAQDLLSTSNIIRPGDHIDLMFSFDFAKADPELANGMHTFAALQDIQVAAVVRGPASGGQPGAQGPAMAYLLAVDPQDALTIKYFRDSGAAPELALRSPAAVPGPFEVVPVNGDYVINRYHIGQGANR